MFSSPLLRKRLNIDHIAFSNNFKNNPLLLPRKADNNVLKGENNSKKFESEISLLDVDDSNTNTTDKTTNKQHKNGKHPRNEDVDRSTATVDAEMELHSDVPSLSAETSQESLLTIVCQFEEMKTQFLQAKLHLIQLQQRKQRSKEKLQLVQLHRLKANPPSPLPSPPPLPPLILPQHKQHTPNTAPGTASHSLLPPPSPPTLPSPMHLLQQHTSSSTHTRLPSSSTVPTWLLICISLVASISIITINHTVFHAYQFHYVWTLSSIHYTFMTLFLWLVQRFTTSTSTTTTTTTPANLNTDPYYYVHLCTMASIATFANVISNYSLRYNSIASYQLYKLCVIPSQVLLYTYLYNKKFTWKTLQSLCILLIGVAIATSPEFSTNRIGLCIGLFSSVVVIPFDTVYNGERAKHYNWTSMQVNRNTGWIRAILSSLMAYVLEREKVIMSWKMLWSDGDGSGFLVLVAMSCICAVGVNVSSVAIIKRSTAVGYQVLGHSKTVGVIAVSLLRRTGVGEVDQIGSLKILMGVCVSMLGSWMYTKEKQQEQNKIIKNR